MVESSAQDYIITDVLMPTEERGKQGYAKFDVVLSEGLIKSVTLSAGPVAETAGGPQVVDGTNKMLLPGFVNAHTHSIEHWGRGAITQLPLELWVAMLYQKVDPRGLDPACPAHMVYLSSLHMGVETLMSGGTAVIDHLFVRDMADLEAAVKAYEQLGIRAYIAPMIGDLDRMNYFPIVLDADDRNAKAKESNCSCNGLGEGGTFRTSFPPYNPEATKQVLQLWEEAVEKFHCPEKGINIALGPVHNWGCSEELMKKMVDMRKKYDLCGHIHLLESRAQVLHNRTRFPDGGAVRHMFDVGWLQLKGTSLAHCCWLDENDQKLIAEAGAVVVHNPMSNTRLGSGIAPIRQYLNNGVTVALGCDGACSSDGQDLLEAVKLACILNPLTTPEYRDWLKPREVLKLAAEGGAAAIGMTGKAGAVKPGYVADLVLYDLTALSLLPRTDPVGLLVLGRPSAGAGGNALHSVWVNGRLVLEDGVPKGIDLAAFRKELIDSKPNYIDPATTDPSGTTYEAEYRAAMGLEGPLKGAPESAVKNYPKYRVNYDADIPSC
eukprot:TRINITY_DN10968_c0_g1_i1.p1 TRINITY_DN10968_c0_g1~~TRINITY_DN10968_c0_g1_i1.p1  ORF type:complete len:549 (-),score=133.29 TRINITY_DN10968_c0_g1_i1:205-1851(-)